MAEAGSAGSLEYLMKGQEALARGAWAEARSAFEAAVADEESAEALEGLGMAAWWLEDGTATIDARRRAYRLYRSRADAAGAARAAIALAMDFFLEGEPAVTRGWIQRARRLLEGNDLCPELGWLAICEAHVALLVDHDPAAAENGSGQAVAVGKSLGDVDLEMLGLAYQGFARVSMGRIDEGMPQLDEATTAAMAGEMSDVDSTATACCCLIYACERVRDYGRAAQWCERLKQFSERWSYKLMFWICRTHYAGILIWRGAWDEAESELEAAIESFERTRPAQAAEALVRLAELRRRQGRFDEADVLLTRAESGAARMLGSTLASLVRAELALAMGEAEDALDWAERFRAEIPAESWAERAATAEVLVRARLAAGLDREAREAASELRSLADRIATDPVRAAAHLAEGLVAADAGNHSSAKQHLDAAVGLYERSGAPFEAAQARLELARSLSALARADAAQREARGAADSLRALGASVEAERAKALAGGKSATGRAPGGLTRREIEILRLVAQGLGDREIAAQLVLSEHTVHRHVANVLAKLRLSSRAAAVAYAAKHGLL